MQYLLGFASPSARGWFLDLLMDETLTATIFTRASITAIGSVDSAEVREKLRAFGWKALEADPEDSDAAALHLLWLYGEFSAVRVILESWRSRGGVEMLEGFEEDHPMPAVAANHELARAFAAEPGSPGPMRPQLGATFANVRADEVAEAAQAWDEFSSTVRSAGAAEREIGRVGPRSVLDYAVSVGGADEYVARVLVSWFTEAGFADAIAVLGREFFVTYYDLLLDVAVSDALVAASVLRALRRAARTAGHADLVTKAARAEIATYGVHDASGLLIKLATR